MILSDVLLGLWKSEQSTGSTLHKVLLNYYIMLGKCSEISQVILFLFLINPVEFHIVRIQLKWCQNQAFCNFYSSNFQNFWCYSWTSLEGSQHTPSPTQLHGSLAALVWLTIQITYSFFLHILFSSLDNNLLWKRVAGRTLVFCYQNFVIDETMSYIMLVYEYQNLGFLWRRGLTDERSRRPNFEDHRNNFLI